MHWIGRNHHNYRNRGGRASGCDAGFRPCRQDKIYLLAHQFRCELLQAIHPAFRVAHFKDEVSALDIATFAQSFHQCGIPPGICHRLAGPEIKIAKTPGFALLLRHQRRGECARANRNNESAPIIHAPLLLGTHCAHIYEGQTGE